CRWLADDQIEQQGAEHHQRAHSSSRSSGGTSPKNSRASATGNSEPVTNVSWELPGGGSIRRLSSTLVVRCAPGKCIAILAGSAARGWRALVSVTSSATALMTLAMP